MSTNQPLPTSSPSPTTVTQTSPTEPPLVEDTVPGMRRLLWACSGANPQILALCPSEHQRYASLGGAVLISSTMAAISGTFALATASHYSGPGWVALVVFTPLGLLYGTAIFGIDRFLVSNSLNPITADQLTSTNQAGDANSHRRPRVTEVARTVATAAPRLLLAVLIGVLIAEPLLLWLFKAEIDQQIHDTTTTRLQVELDELDTHYQSELDRITTRESRLTATDPDLAAATDALARLDTEITTVNNQVADLHVTLRGEIGGLNIGGTSGRAGDGPVADEIRAEIELATNRLDALVEQRQRAQAQLDTLTTTGSEPNGAAEELAGLAEQRTALGQHHASDRAAVIEVTRASDGLLARIEALEWLTRHDRATGTRTSMTSVGVAVWLVRLWILVLDATPVLFKIVLSVRADRPYEMLLAAQQQREISLARSLSRRSNPQRTLPIATGRVNGQHGAPAAGSSRRRYPVELRRQAVQMVYDTQADANSQWEAIVTVSRALGPSPETIRTWVRQAESTNSAATDPPNPTAAASANTHRPTKR